MEQQTVIIEKASDGWFNQMIDLIEVTERHPLGFLIICLLVAIWRLVRRLDKLKNQAKDDE